MPRDPDPAPVTQLAARCESDPFFLAHPLALYRDRNGLTDDDLAAYLGVGAAGLVRLKLCRAGGRAEEYADTGCDVARLAGIPGDGH